MKQYVWNILISIDQLGNALLAGNPDETISSRIGRAKLREAAGGKPISWLTRFVDRVLDWIDPGHSIDAIEWDEVDRQGNLYHTKMCHFAHKKSGATDGEVDDTASLADQ